MFIKTENMTVLRSIQYAMSVQDVLNQKVDLLLYLSYDGKEFEIHPDSVYSHNPTTLGNIENQAIAIGGGANTEVELFNIANNTWTTQTQFPYCGKS